VSSGQQVDVLAVMDRELSDIAGLSCAEMANERKQRAREREFRAARAAVAESIETQAELVKALRACDAKIRLLSGRFLGGDVQDECIAAHYAIARVVGAST
jgi:hypothetical protein